ncbi:DUF262 domain-containing protein [Bradyrhizobium sp. 160]|uniref:GmrSD restriction endonuclease domain-containing protein n=2 Tax=unclassified Bradyrhizobium TaxID=2631580 RepID=UPI001FF835B0|nr:DUF262 domain-containing protein [Bradyrhizobium sp. 160]MCK1624821.1 DUF262 domain-containing protein [Bradyrhizobium sp. 160]
MTSDVKVALEESTSFGEASGIEVEARPLLEDVAIGEPFNPDDIDVATRSMTIDLLLSRIAADAIDLEPDFQRRRGIWTDRQQSRLIESLLLRIPLPTLYAAEDEQENWAIVDGIQRLTTITRFISPELIEEAPLRLSGLEYLGNSFNGMVYDDLPARLKRRLRETELVVHLIRHGTPQEVKFNIFARINTGGLPLSSQELRHALIPGQARNFLRDLAASDAFKVATTYSIRDERMADREMVLRFVAFRLNEPEEFRAYDFDRFLGDAMRQINTLSRRKLDRLGEEFVAVMNTAAEIFGDDAFRKRYREQDARMPINKALFETVSVAIASLADSERRRCVDRATEIRARMMVLMQDRVFESSISQGTGDIAKVRYRFMAMERVFQEVARG